MAKTAMTTETTRELLQYSKQFRSQKLRDVLKS